MEKPLFVTGSPVFWSPLRPCLSGDGLGSALRTSLRRAHNAILDTAEHQHLHHDLAEALAAGGKTAAAAKKVETVLMPHFAEEEQYAMPPLSLLQTIAEGREPTEAQAHDAIRSSSLRQRPRRRTNRGRPNSPKR